VEGRGDVRPSASLVAGVAKRIRAHALKGWDVTGFVIQRVLSEDSQ
jgi:hypothetical protein